LQAARSVLGEEAFARARAEGQAMTLERAVACALEELAAEPAHQLASLPSHRE
jgi:hypothetical protein